MIRKQRLDNLKVLTKIKSLKKRFWFGLKNVVVEEEMGELRLVIKAAGQENYIVSLILSKIKLIYQPKYCL